MVYNLLNLPILREMADSNTGKTAINFEPLDENTLADESESGDFFEDTVEGGLVENDRVLGLVLHSALGPLLLLCGLATAG